jgi:hypothetical protein
MPSERLEKIDQLAVSLAGEHEQKGGWPYHYVVTRRGRSFAGFVSAAGVWRFIEERGLRCAGDFPGVTPLEGSFYKFRTLGTLPTGVETRVWQWTDYTRATITEHEGLRVVNYHHADAKNRVVYDFRETVDFWERMYARGSFDGVWRAREIGEHGKYVVMRDRKYDTVIFIRGNEIEAFLERGLNFGLVDAGAWGSWVAINYNDYHQLTPHARGEDPRD